MNQIELILADETLKDRFYSKVYITDTCWLWTGSTRDSRYGNIRVGGKKGPMVAAHRIQAVWAGMDIENKVVMHKCDNGLCVNPNHLIIGDQNDNIQDMISKGREFHHSGVDNGNAVLSEEQVREIRKLAKIVPSKGRGNAKEIAKILELNHNTVWRVLTNRSYQQVEC